jgi:hypothetical protein
MAVSRFSKARKIPTKVTTRKSSPTTTNFGRGIYTYKPNDAMDYDEIYLAQNARFERIGEYKTRRGLAMLTEPIGKTTTDNYGSGYTLESLPRTFNVTPSTPRRYAYTIRLKAATQDDCGIIQLKMVNANTGAVITSCAKLDSTDETDVAFIFKDGIDPGTYKATVSIQGGASKDVKMAFIDGAWMRKTTSATEGHITNIFEANIDGVKTILFTFKTNAGVTTLYRMAADGTVTSIRTLPTGVEKVRFSQNVNQIRYADGKEGPRLINPANSWSDSAITTTDLKTGVDLQIKVSNILAGTQDNMIYFDADTTTQAVWTYPYGFMYAPAANFYTTATLNEYVVGATTTTTITKSTLTPVSSTHLVSALATGDLILDENGNYGKVTSISGNNVTVTSDSHAANPVNSYDKFDRDFRQNFPAIKTGDPLTAMFNLGGVVYFLTRRNKYYMYSQTADVWTQQASSAQHGTFSQESVVTDLNYAYYACDDGIYRFDGSSEASLTQNTIQSTYDAIKGKDSIVLEMYNNRLYVFYSSTGTVNDSCLVFNINLGLWESFDTGLPVSATTARQTASNRFICGSSHFGQLFLHEDTDNEYADLGAPIDFDLETAYLHFGTPSQLHRITKWRPEFSTTSGDYTIKCGYALDFTDDVKYAFSINLKNQTVVDEHYVWDNPPDYGNPVEPTRFTTIPQVNGQFRRVQIRYQHHAAFEPVRFKSHTLQTETQRLR